MSKSRCCNEYAIKYSSIGIKGDVNTHYTCTYCGKISDKPKEDKEDKALLESDLTIIREFGEHVIEKINNQQN